MKKLLFIFLISFGMHGIVFCMEKPATTDLQTLTLQQFFDTNVPKIIKEETLLKKYFKKLPNDMKYAISVMAFDTFHQKWWNCNKQWKHKSAIYALSFTKENQLTMSLHDQIITIDPHTNATSLSFSPKGKIVSLTYSPDGTLFAYGSRSGYIHIAQATDIKKKISSLRFKKNPIWALSFAPNNKYLAIGHGYSKNGHRNVRVINIKNKKIIFSQKIADYIYGVILHSNNSLSYSMLNNTVCTINIKTKKIHDNLYQTTNIDHLLALSYDNNNRYALGFRKKNKENTHHNEGYLHIVDQITKNIIFSFCTSAPIYSLSFSYDKKQLAVGLNNGLLLILQKHIATPEQRLLREILFLWTQVEKPDKNITEPTQLLATIINKFNLNKTEVTTTWDTFPPDLQAYLWNRISSIIKKYGK